MPHSSSQTTADIELLGTHACYKERLSVKLTLHKQKLYMSCRSLHDDVILTYSVESQIIAIIVAGAWRTAYLHMTSYHAGLQCLAS